MNKEILTNTVSKLIARPKGILAIDESTGTCHARFEKLGVPQTEEKRREYRELLVTTPGIEEYISGYIVVPETAFQKTNDGVLFTDILAQKGILLGVTSNTGYQLFDEKNGVKQEITVGIDDLLERMKIYKEAGASFSKWREMTRIGDGLPTEEFMRAGAKLLAQYATICHENDVVPIVEPEIVIDGDHSIEKCYEVTAHNLDILFAELKSKDIFLPGVILKTSMVLSGKNAGVRASAKEVAEMTVKCLKEHVPADIGGIVFLSGGQSDEEATENLNAMNQMSGLPWRLTFSYGRAIQNPALIAWAKNPEDVATAQNGLLEAAKRNSLASIGQYKSS